MAAGQTVDLTVDHITTEGATSVVLYDTALNVLTTATSSSGAASVSAYSIAGEDYFIEVVLSGDDVAQAGVMATLSAVQITPTVCPVDAYEPNDDLANAMPLPIGLTADLGACASDVVDWFSVDLLAGDILDVAAYFSQADADLDLFVLDAQPATIDYPSFIFAAPTYSDTTTDDETVAYTAVVDGTHYVAVRLYAQNGNATLLGGTYDLEATVTTVP